MTDLKELAKRKLRARAQLRKMGLVSGEETFKATEIYCPKCAAPKKVVEDVGEVTKDGVEIELKCETCGTVLGSRIDKTLME